MNIYQELSKACNYNNAFERLRAKAKSAPYNLGKAPLEPELNLRWVLENEKIVTCEILKHIKKKNILSPHASRNKIHTDKERFIYSQNWVQKILQSTFCELAGKLIEPTYSNKLYSFRKGTGSHQAIKIFADYLKSAKQENRQVFIIKRDIEKYDRNINIDLLTKKFKHLLGEQDEFIWRLLDSFLKPELIDTAETMKGLPMGFHITPLSENIYLSNLDAELEKQAVQYMRYGDDIIIASSNKSALETALNIAENEIHSLGLNFHPQKQLNAYFNYSLEKIQTEKFRPYESIDYLGFNISKDAEIFISRNKLSALKKQLSKCINTAHASNLAYGVPTLGPIIKSLNLFLNLKDIDPNLHLVFHATNNNRKLKHLDTWIARQVLRKFYKGTQNKIFRNFSFKKLRREGLLSLQFLKNSYQREIS